MTTKKYSIAISIVLAAVVLGIFLVYPGKKTFIVKNTAPYLANVQPKSDYKPIAENIGNLSIPQIKIPQNLTESFAKVLAQGIISENENPEIGKLLPGPGINMPDPSKMAEEYITNGLKQASENVLNIAPVQLKISPDNSKETITAYLLKIKNIINSNLTGVSLLDLLDEINKNNGQGVEKLLPIISAHEAAANQLEAVPVPSNLKNLITEEIRLLRITANVLRPLINIENDPLAAIAATQQFGLVVQNWLDLQKKFNNFMQKFNQ